MELFALAGFSGFIFGVFTVFLFQQKDIQYFPTPTLASIIADEEKYLVAKNSVVMRGWYISEDGNGFHIKGEGGMPTTIMNLKTLNDAKLSFIKMCYGRLDNIEIKKY